MSCDTEDTFGPYPWNDVNVTVLFDISHVMYQSFTFTVTTEATFEVEMSNIRAVRFERCAERHPEDSDDDQMLLATTGVVGDDVIHTITLSAGLWRANLINWHGSAIPVEMVIRPVE
jgi:hypothetical protein